MTGQKFFGFISFFSGAMGLDLGLEYAGFTPLAANDMDSVACETIRRNRPELKLFDEDIREITPERICNELNISPGDIFLICGGPPCQSFSTAGKRRGLNDDRGNAFLHFVWLIGCLRPCYVVIENVRGLLSAPLKHRPHSKRGLGFPPLEEDELPGGALRLILNLLRQQGYELTFNLYNTANFGVPQTRERLVILGSREGCLIPHLRPTHDQYGRYGLPLWRTFAEAVSGLPDEHEYLPFSPKRLRLIQLLAAGQNWRDLPPDLWPEALGKAISAKGGRVGFCRRVAWDRPCPTLVTRPTMPATELAHPSEPRPLSVQEYARVQTFPDSWQFAGRTADKYRQIGNAVPVEFGAAIGRHLLDFHAGRLIESYVEIPPSRYRNTDENSWCRLQKKSCTMIDKY